VSAVDLDSSPAPAAVLHVDLDGARQIYQQNGWRYEWADDPLFHSGMSNLLDFMDRNGTKATLFTIASDLEDGRKAEWLQEAVRRGHEIASHSVTHAKLNRLASDAKRREIADSKQRLEQGLGTEVRGFRAPAYTVDRECLELLDEHGYAYDSSVFPTAAFASRLQIPSLADGPHRPLHGRRLMELPLPDYRPAPFPFHPCYSLLLGRGYFRAGLRRFRRKHRPLVLLFHLTDFSEPMPRERLAGWRSKIMTLSNLSAGRKLQRCQEMLNTVSENYQITDTDALIEAEADRLAEQKPVMMAISTTHETGTAIFVGDELKAAISEERMDRVKFSTKYPPKKSIVEAVRISGVDPKSIQDVIVCGLPAGQLFGKLAKGQIQDALDFHALNDYFPHLCKAFYRSFYFYRAVFYNSVKRFLAQQYGINPRLRFVEHHLCHASAAYRTAPFDDALVVTADGVGDDVSLTISVGSKGKLERLKEIPYPHSFGQFYTACTQVLGFRGGRHEGKITGLSGFGKVDPELYAKVKSTIKRSGPDFTLHKKYYSEGLIRGFSFERLRKGEDLFDVLQYRNYKAPLKKLLEGYPREDVAAVFQQLLEDEMVAVVKPYAEQTGLKNLALCGGVFANVKLNSALYTRLGMERVYIFPAMGDGGLSVGACLEHIQAMPKPFDSVYWGPGFSDEEMERALSAATGEGLRFRREQNIEQVVAQHVANKKVVARFNGRMEFGPRALGNRSILYSATDPSANKWLNNRLRRTEFMPFAPIAMAERAGEMFKNINGTEHACKFMTIILDCTEWTKQNAPAIVHVDGTARPQLVSEEINPSMYRILDYHEKLTGLPLMVNTSFNMHEEPIVCTPEDAVRAYLDSRLDYLAMGPFLAWCED
jgi:carbamoyltransferase